MKIGTKKATLIAAAAALVVGLAAIGTALAQQAPTPTTTSSPRGERGQRGRFLEVVASKLGIPTDRLQQAISEARQELGMQRPGRPGAERRGELRERFRDTIQRGLEVIAGELHISVDQLRTELRGSSISAVSRAHGVDPQQVATALTNAGNQRIDAAQAAGRLSADQATRLKQRVDAGIQRMMDRQIPGDGARRSLAITKQK